MEAGDFRLLEMAVNYALQIKETEDLSHVNALVLSEFEASLQQAQSILEAEAAGQSEINASWTRLARAIQMLGFTTDFTQLDLLIQRAEDVDLDAIADPALKEELEQALDEARSVRASQTALDDISIAQAIARLQAALDAIENAVQIDTTLLALIVNAVQDTDLSLYVEQGKAEFTEALTKAQTVLARPDSQRSVDEAAISLNSAWLNLRLKADESLLQSLRAALESLQKAGTESLTPAQARTRESLIQEIGQALANPDQLAAKDGNDLIEKADAWLSSIGEAAASKDDAAKKSASVSTAAATSVLGWMTLAAAAAGSLLKGRKRRK